MSAQHDDGTYVLGEAARLNSLMETARVDALSKAYDFAHLADMFHREQMQGALRELLDEYHDARLDYEGRVADAYAYSQRRYVPEPGEPGGPREPDDNPDDNEERKEREQ